jgi:hypothetical protein
MPDHSCSLSSQQWNAVYLRHSDGSVTWYGHLKVNSLTTKQVGDSVAAGEFLGVMGSSGDSTGPHLHFEVHDRAGNVIDPFAGPCNTSNADSWWTQQRPYYESALDLVMTGTAPVQFNTCPIPDTESHSAYFHPGQTVYVTAFLTDQQRVNPTVFTLYQPNGGQFSTATMTSDADFYPASYWWWGFPLPANATSGTWRAEVAFNGQTRSVEFEVGTTGEPPRTSIVEYYNAALNDYFVTSYTAEIAMLDAGTVVPGWGRTGTTFPAFSAPDPDLDTVCRFYGAPGTGINTHFYTAFAPECAALKQSPAWRFEGNAFYIDTPEGVQCPAATRPVYRLYNNSLDGVPRHRYATNWTVISFMQSQSWMLEGVAMCTPL